MLNNPTNGVLAPDEHAVGGPRILIVEDCPSNVLIIELYLQDIPCRIQVAENGLEGVEIFKENAFDLVLMDIQMPVMDGYEATRRMRRVEEESGRGRTPVLAVTAHVSEENRERALAAGCDAFLSKPLRRQTLLETMSDYLDPQ